MAVICGRCGRRLADVEDARNHSKECNDTVPDKEYWFNHRYIEYTLPPKDKGITRLFKWIFRL